MASEEFVFAPTTSLLNMWSLEKQVKDRFKLDGGFVLVEERATAARTRE
jgi:hypothetical protein